MQAFFSTLLAHGNHRPRIMHFVFLAGLSSIATQHGVARADSCANPAIYDLDGSGLVGTGDIIALIDGMNGPEAQSPRFDLDGSGIADEQDIQALIGGVAACRGVATPGTNGGSHQAGGPFLNVSLVPSFPGPYPSNTTLEIDIFIQRTESGADIPLRLLQFDVEDTDPQLSLSLPVTHPAASPGPIDFWNFGTTPACSANPANCGFNHFIDDSIVSDAVLVFVYIGLSQNLNFQVVVPGNASPIHVGTVLVTTPSASGSYLLDVMNADKLHSDFGAQIAFSFTGTTFWRANQGEISGGTLNLVIDSLLPVPAVSDWGLVILTLMGLIVGTILFDRSRRDRGLLSHSTGL